MYGFVHRRQRLKLRQAAQAQNQLGITRVDFHAIYAIVIRRICERWFAMARAITNGRVGDLKTRVIDTQRPFTTGREHINRQRKLFGNLCFNIDRGGSKIRIGVVGIARTGTGVIDQPPTGQTTEPLQLAAHLPVPGGGFSDRNKLISILQIEITHLGNFNACEKSGHHRHPLRQQVAPGAVPGVFIVVSVKVMMRSAANTTQRARMPDGRVFRHAR